MQHYGDGHVHHHGTPLFAPVALELGIDPIHLGVVMIVNLAIGLFTPPVGVNLYVACGIGNIKIEEISKGVIPCLVAEPVVLLPVTCIPGISLLFVGAWSVCLVRGTSPGPGGGIGEVL